ncbi:MAG: radical SAM protein [Negativicutes bacterium]
MEYIVVVNNISKDVIDILLDSDNRRIDHLRLSVTEQCNLHCSYCAPEIATDQYQTLSIAEIRRIATVLFAAGINSARITGGEPLMRHDIVEIAFCIKNIGFSDVSLTTNATMLTNELAKSLLTAGISRINIGFPSVNAVHYRTITGCNIAPALAGIKTATEIFSDVRINVVMVEGFDQTEFEAVRDFSNSMKITPRFIEYMPAFGAASTSKFDILGTMLAIGAKKIEPLSGQGPAEYYMVPGFDNPVGLILPLHKKFCHSCRRIRLNSLGELRRCLFDNQLLSLLELLNTRTQLEVIQSIKAFIKEKPSEHFMNAETRLGHSMAKIGG